MKCSEPALFQRFHRRPSKKLASDWATASKSLTLPVRFQTESLHVSFQLRQPGNVPGPCSWPLLLKQTSRQHTAQPVCLLPGILTRSLDRVFPGSSLSPGGTYRCIFNRPHTGGTLHPGVLLPHGTRPPQRPTNLPTGLHHCTTFPCTPTEIKIKHAAEQPSPVFILCIISI